MSIARDVRLVEASTQQIFAEFGARIESMIAIQMAAYPAGWTEEERREMAERHLFGERAS